MTVPIRPPDPRVMKALAAYKKQGLNRLADMAGLSQGTGDAVQSFAMGATEPLDVKGALRAARRGIGALYHGSPNTALEVLASHPPARQYDNATSVFGGFATPDKAEAARYAGKAGRVYEVDGSLSNPHEMSWGEFGRFQAPHKAHDGSPLPPDAWAKRAEQLKQEAQALRKQLEAAGHDGIVVRDSRGNVKEQAFFRDTPMRDSLTVSGVRRGIEAWHGSPHKFDKFSLEKIGTGEGAQAYGHGLYFAENPVVAKGYREKLSVGSYDPDRGVQPDASSTAARISRMFEDDGMRWRKGARSIDDVVRRFATKHRKEPSGIHEYTFRDGSRWFELPGGAWDVRGRRDDGALYRVRLDVSPDELLDWDATVAKQSPKVQNILKREYGGAHAEGATGQSVYKLASDLADDPEMVSKDLLANGIPGIRYLDGGSRAAGDGTRNYVIFDPERIQILERLAALGIGGEAVRTMLAQAKAAAQPQQSQPPTLPAVTVGR